MRNKCEIPRTKSPITFEQMSIIIHSQRLWQQLSYWVRALIIATLRDPARQPSVLDRLYTGTTREFYDYFRLMYGAEVAEHLLQIISGTVVNLLNVIEGIKNNNQDQVNSNTLKLYETADVFSAYLHELNSHWEELLWRNYLYQFIRLILDQTVTIATEKFDDEIVIAGRI